MPKTQAIETPETNVDAEIGRRVHQLIWDRKTTQTALGPTRGIDARPAHRYPLAMTDITPQPAPATTPAPGWYDDGSGRQRWYDGTAWTDQYQPAPAVHTAGPMTAGSLNVKREVIYNREQKGHSIILHLLISPFLLFINLIYISVSPNHFWHA